MIVQFILIRRRQLKMMLQRLVLVLCIGVLRLSAALKNVEQFRDRYNLQSFSPSDPANCSIGEAMEMISELYSMMITSSSPDLGNMDIWQYLDLGRSLKDQYTRLAKSVHQIESRLRSMEQPIWRLVPGNRKEWIHCKSGLCRCNPDTKSFICWSTNFQSLPALQVIPMNMVTIDLSGNALSTLHKDSFRGLTLLRELDLSHNLLDFLPYELFDDLDSLTQLFLQHNYLEELDGQIFWKLRQLRLLDISKNLLTVLPGSLFNYVQRLRIINLSDNKIKAFPAELMRDQLSLEELDMSRNDISALQSGNMQSLAHLKVLNFSWNSIFNISDDFFAGLTTLRTLFLNNNRISSISKNTFKYLKDLITLDLSMNLISEIDTRAFYDLSNLQDLLLNHNKMSHIPDGLFLGTVSLTRLTLFSNNLTALEADDFQGLLNLKDIMLNNNFLKSIETDALTPLVNLEKLRIDSNKLQYLPHGALTGLKNLLAVKLDKNSWHCDCRALYLARWIREFNAKLWAAQPVCRGPGKLEGREVGLMRYNDLCDGQWASMLSLSPRLPVRKIRIRAPMNYTEYFNVYLKHIYTTTPRREENSTTKAARNYR